MLVSKEYIFGHYEEIEHSEDLNKFIEEGFHIIHCDASYEDGIGACSVQIRNSGEKERKIKSRSFSTLGPVEAEMRSVLHGIREAKKTKSIRKALFTNDNYNVINLIVGNHTPRKSHIIKTTNKVKEALGELNFPYNFAWVRSKINKKVDREAKRVLKRKEKAVELRVEKRKEQIIFQIEKSKNLKYEFKEGKHFVKSEKYENWYESNLENLFCSCAFWKNKSSRTESSNDKNHQNP